MKFANSVSDLCRLIDLRIDYKDYTGARVLVSDMETFLKKIVSAMLLHGDIIDIRESDMIMTFIHRIVEDKRMIIMKSEKIRAIWSPKKMIPSLSRKRLTGRSILLLLLMKNLVILQILKIPRRSIITGEMMMTRMTSNHHLKIKGLSTFYFLPYSK